MEVAAALGVCAAVPLIYSKLRPRFKTKVNCWFCNTDTKVSYENRNSFVCPSCEQYNGFKIDGDYNRRIPEQSFSTPTRFCKPTSQNANAAKRSELIPDRFGRLNMSPKLENGLCSECNRNQEIIMNKVADFEPMDEDRWNEELEDYKYKLERMYQLCTRCSLTVHGKIEEDKRKYSYLFELRHKLKHAIGETINNLTSPAARRKSRLFFFAGGSTCERLRLATLISMIALFTANLDFLQQDAGVTLVSFPKQLESALPYIYDSSIYIHLGVLLAHCTACYTNKCRTTLPDLLLPFIHLISLLTFIFEWSSDGEDLALLRCACSSLVVVLAGAVCLLPRKKLHKKRANRILSSAFSVASTPASQCSSQASRNASMIDENSSSSRSRRQKLKASPFDRSPSSSPRRSGMYENGGFLRDVTNCQPSPPSVRSSISPNTFRWRERAQSPEKEPLNKENAEAMDWDDSESIAPSSVSRSHFRPGLFAQAASLRRMDHREETPSRELAPSVASMSLLQTTRDDCASVWSMKTARPLAASNSAFSRQNRSPARSIFAPKSSIGAARFQRPYLPETNTRNGSVFTSISQQDRDSVVGGVWQWRVIVFLFSLIFIVLIMQVMLFYMLLKK